MCTNTLELDIGHWVSDLGRVMGQCVRHGIGPDVSQSKQNFKDPAGFSVLLYWVLILVVACQLLVHNMVLVRRYLLPRLLSVWTTGFYVQVSVFGTICSL